MDFRTTVITGPSIGEGVLQTNFPAATGAMIAFVYHFLHYFDYEAPRLALLPSPEPRRQLKGTAGA